MGLLVRLEALNLRPMTTTNSPARPWLDPSARPFIQIKNVTKRFDDVVAVDRVSLDIFAGELFCLLGGSGCGKTTLLRMLAGFETPSAGTISIDGADMAGLAPYARPTNMMFQSYALFPHMSVERNVAYGLHRDGVQKDEVQTRVAQMLRLVQLDGLAGRKPHQLSGGQRQRVALARALIKRPKLLLLDEPLGALDKKLREETQFELVNIQENLGITFVVVTHDQEEAMTLASRIGVMDDGKIIQVDEPHALYERPNSRFVADFVGSVNLIEGRADGEILHTEDGPLQIPSAQGEVCFAIRPEKLTIAPKNSDVDALSGTIEDIAYLGNQSIYIVRLGSGRRLRIARANRHRSETQITWDDTVSISWEPQDGVILTA